MLTVCSIKVKEGVVSGDHLHRQSVLGVGVRHRKHIHCGTGRGRFRNCDSDGSAEGKLRGVTLRVDNRNYSKIKRNVNCYWMFNL